MLPGENQRAITPPQEWRIAIGTKVEGQVQPDKLDYISLRHLSRQGKNSSYVVDPEMQKRMCEAAGVAEKPTVIPVSLIGNAYKGEDGKPKLPESILFSELAHYSGGRRNCFCGDFDEEGLGTALRRHYREKTGKGDKVYNVFEREEELVCNPATCPLATGEANEKYPGTPMCKPHVIASITLPWAPSVGSSAKFKTTGWASYYAMRNSLITIALQTDGWLHELPLWFVHDWAKNADGHMIPVCFFKYMGTTAQLKAAKIALLAEWTGQEQQVKQLEAGVVEAVVETIEDEDDQEATQGEFYSKQAREPISAADEAAQTGASEPAMPTPGGEEDAAEEVGAVEGEFEPEDPVDTDFEQDSEGPSPTNTDAPTSEPAPQPPADEPPPAPEPTEAIPPFFAEAPESYFEIAKKLATMGEQDVTGRFLAERSEKLCGKKRQALPTVATFQSPDAQEAFTAAFVEFVEQWWQAEGYAKHGEAPS